MRISTLSLSCSRPTSRRCRPVSRTSASRWPAERLRDGPLSGFDPRTTPPSAEPFGVYVHIPFCTKRCDYCAFATWTDRDHLIEAYVDACVTELGGTSLPPATSVFFGGGTPSLLAPEALSRILHAVARADEAEVTVECNPDTVSAEKLGGYRAIGVNRVSFGVQSMVPEVLLALGRTHDPGNVRRAVGWARDAGFGSINLDLIYGAAAESGEDWDLTLNRTLELAPDHVSAYALTVEAGTPLAGDPSRHPDDDDQAAKYEQADLRLGAAGLANYEISNWARPGAECRHNWLYWTLGSYRGVGCAAHSHDGAARRRWWNLRTPERYIAAVAAGETVEAASETLSEAECRAETVQLALRTRAGVPAALVLPATAQELVEGGWLARDGDRFVLTGSGRLLGNEIAVRLL